MLLLDVTDTLVGPEGHLDQSSAAALHGWRISNGHSTVFASREATDATGPRLVLETGSC